MTPGPGTETGRVPDVRDVDAQRSGPWVAVVRRAIAFRARIRRNAVLDTSWRVAVFVVGALVVAAGILMLVTPGPGWLAIVAGFAILASEFMWARRALLRAKRTALVAKEKALDPRVRRRNQVLGCVAAIVVIAVGVWYVVTVGLALPWDVNWAAHLP